MNRKVDFQAKVVDCQQESGNPNVFLLTLDLGENSGFEASPGQFVVLKSRINSAVSPRPFSVMNQEQDIIQLLIQVVGSNTKAYSELKRGETVILNGPEGLPVLINHEMEKFILVAGGIGVAPLIFLAEKLIAMRKEIVVKIGAKNKAQLSGMKFFRALWIEPDVILEEEGNRTGRVTDLLEDELRKNHGKSIVVACGPKLMLRKVAELAEQHGNRCIVLLEERMTCGMGACKSCAVPLRKENPKDVTQYFYVCSDGPAIDAEKVDWEVFAPLPQDRVVADIPIDEISMTVRLGKGFRSLPLKHPTMNASGCLSENTLLENKFSLEGLGAMVTKGIMIKPRSGNPMPRTCELPFGMLNAIGLSGVGIDVFIEQKLPIWLSFGLPVIVNIAEEKIEGYGYLAQRLQRTNVTGIEINISCPNIETGSISFGVDPVAAQDVVRAVRRETDKFVIAKLTPNVTDIVEIARAVKGGGADAISLVNTFRGMDIDLKTLRPKLGNITGGYSGPAIKPQALALVHDVYRANLGVPIIGMGGIVSGDDASKFIAVGTTVVAVGTGGFDDRHVFSRICDGIKRNLRYHGFSSVDQLVGKLVTN